jgi:hypothetical protein
MPRSGISRQSIDCHAKTRNRRHLPAGTMRQVECSRYNQEQTVTNQQVLSGNSLRAHATIRSKQSTAGNSQIAHYSTRSKQSTRKQIGKFSECSRQNQDEKSNQQTICRVPQLESGIKKPTVGDLRIYITECSRQNQKYKHQQAIL